MLPYRLKPRYAAVSLHCIFPSQCFQRESHHLHNEGYYQAVVHCWWWDFQPNVASAAALCTRATSVFSGQQEQILCSLMASSECWFESDDAFFYFLKAQIPSTEDTNCRHSLPFTNFSCYSYIFAFLMHLPNLTSKNSQNYSTSETFCALAFKLLFF